MRSLAIATLVFGLAANSTGATADGSPAADPVFEAARDGSPPTMGREEFYAAKARLTLGFSRFRSRFVGAVDSTAQVTKACARYAGAVQKSFSRLQTALEQIRRGGADGETLDDASDAAFLARVRFGLLQLAAVDLYMLMKNGDEGGASSLDPDAHARCEFAGRDGLVGGFGDQIAASIAFGPAALGAPGLLTLERAEDRLVRIARRNEYWRRASAGSFAVASFVLVPFISIRVPMLISAGVRAALGPASAGILSGKVAQGSLRGAVLAGTFAGGMLINEKIEPEEDPREKNFGVSWDDRVTQVEALLDAPESYAELALAYLGQQKNIVGGYFTPYLRERSGALARAYGPSFGETFALAREANLLNNRPLPSRILRLEQILADSYGYQFSCKRGTLASLYVGSVADVDCFAGLKRLARLAYRGEIPELERAQKLSLSVRLTDSDTKFDLAAEPMLLDLNVDEPAARVRALVNRAVHHPALAQRVVDNRRFADLANTFTLNTGLTVSVDHALGFADRWEALGKLVEVARTDPAAFALDADEVRLQNRFTPLGDHGLKLRVGVDAAADLAGIRSFLAHERDRADHAPLVAAFVAAYAAVRGERSALSALGFEANCSGAGELTLSACARTLGDVHAVLSRIGPRFIHPVDIGGVVVRARDEMSELGDVTRAGGRGIWDVREGAKPFDLAYFLRDRGWVHE